MGGPGFLKSCKEKPAGRPFWGAILALGAGAAIGGFVLPHGPWELTSDPPPLTSAKKEQKTPEPAVDRPGFLKRSRRGVRPSMVQPLVVVILLWR